MEEIVKYLLEQGLTEFGVKRVLSNISDDATREDIRREAMALHLRSRGYYEDEIEEILSNISDDETKDEIVWKGMTKYLEKQGLTEEEAEDVLSRITWIDCVKKYYLDVEKIYDSLNDLADYYVKNEIEPLDDYILASLNYDELGREVAEGEGYTILDSGRIVHFENLKI